MVATLKYFGQLQRNTMSCSFKINIDFIVRVRFNLKFKKKSISNTDIVLLSAYHILYNENTNEI